MKNKPIIRHCKNCEWAERHTYNSIYCNVKYGIVAEDFQRLEALFCRYYQKRDETDD